MTPLEREISQLREALQALPESAERTIGLRAARHALSLLARDVLTASDAFYRARKFYALAAQNRKSA